MYITVNGSTYQNAVRVRTAQSVSYTADGLEGIGAVSGVITRYRDDGFEVGSENSADYLRQEAISGVILAPISGMSVVSSSADAAAPASTSVS